jgi:creatinine amidohydrolase/Fe(II)-dependent formamide hydrolase-like protein
MGTDSTTAFEVACRVSAKTGAIVFPNLDYGTMEHPAFYGVFLSDQLYTSVVREVCLGIEKLGFQKILYISGHGPNNACILSALRTLHAERPAQRLFGLAHCMTLINHLMPEFVKCRPTGHSDYRETSIMMAIDQSLVHAEKATGPEVMQHPFSEALQSTGVHLVGLDRGQIHLCHANDDLKTHGGYGRVKGSSKEQGEEILHVLTDFLSGVVNELKTI